MTRVVVLGSTGSVGRQALEVVRAFPEEFRVVGLSGGANVELLRAQAEEFGVDAVALGSHEAAELAGDAACDIVLNAIAGSAGLGATLAALASGRRVALANKESLIVGGELVMAAAAPGQLVSVDSEHVAIAQALRGATAAEVERLLITASGGPFRGLSRSQLTAVTPEEALRHPTWAMGRLITTNSATLVNKALEVLEAHYLFDMPLDRIEVVVHPQSMVHSMVEFIDGTTLAQAAVTDMRLPILAGLTWPQRTRTRWPRIDWMAGQTWTFEAVDEATFPAIKLARQALEAGGTFPAVYNAANEALVDLFHEKRIGFLDIVDGIDRALDAHRTGPAPLTIESITDAESWARTHVEETTTQPV